MVVTVKTALSNNLIEFSINDENYNDSHIEVGLSQRLEQVKTLLERCLAKWSCVKFHVICEANFKVTFSHVYLLLVII